jgi:hypothetical protein
MQRQWLSAIGLTTILLTSSTACNNAKSPTPVGVPSPSASTAAFDEPGRVYLADRQMSLIPPEGFVALSAEDIRAQYPTANPPNYVFSNDDRTASIAITFTPQPLNLKQLPELQQLMGKHMEKTVPGIKWIQRDFMAINGGSWVKLEATAKKQQENLHSDMYFTSFNDRMLGINFSASTEKYPTIKAAFTQSRDSIQIATPKP